MSDIIKKYSNGEITIIWKPALCIHSKICCTQLPAVFNPNRHPWIKADMATTETMVEQIKKCPSGALSFIYNNEEKTSNSTPLNKIEILPNGPIVVYGNIEIMHSDGRVEQKEKTTALCRCGASGNKPFCDGSHQAINFKD